MRARLPRMRPPKPGYLPFEGGLDTETSPWEVKAGRVFESMNYERDVKGGYVDIMGYERYDGSAAPSSASYTLLPVTISGTFTAGDVVTGATSGATARVAVVGTSELVLAIVIGTFVDGENLEVSSVVQGVAAGDPRVGGATDPKLNAQYLAAAALQQRALIGAVPGEGQVLGVYMLSDVVYAFRNRAGGASAAMFRATTSGWVEVALGRELAYTSGGNTAIAVGNTITGATSGATAVVAAVTVESGSFDGGDAAGRVIFASQTGTFVAENLDIGAATNVATIAGDSAAISLLPDGNYEFYRSRFASGAGQTRLYGCDGVNRGFEFDGTTFVPIATGMASDAPEHLVVHRQHLFFSFGPSVQNSAIGNPYAWSVVLGAGEFRCDGNVTGFQREPSAQGNAALAVFNRQRMYLLYGTSQADFELVSYRDEIGAFAGTIQQMAYTVFLDNRGITSMQAVQEFGNFQHSTMSTDIHEWVLARLGLAISSCIVREKNQYRLFFSNGEALYLTFDGKKVGGMMPCQLNKPVRCIASLEAEDGSERIYFGSDDGYVYQLDRGTMLDGDDLDAFIKLHYTNFDVRRTKRWLSPCTIEGRGTGYAELDFGYELGYGDTSEVPPAQRQTKPVPFALSSFWDAPGATWDTLFWDGQTLIPTTGLEFRGTSENVSFLIRKSGNYMKPVRMTGIHFLYVDHKAMR